MRRNRLNRNGFTLIELMLVVAIVGLLAAIAIPKFGNMVLKAKRSAFLGNLAAVRSALRIRNADTEGYMSQFDRVMKLPVANCLDWLLVPKYIDKIPYPKVSVHNGEPYAYHSFVFLGAVPFNDPGVMCDNTYFLMLEDQMTSPIDRLVIACGHKDLTGKAWSQY